MVDWSTQLARLTAMGQTEQVGYRPKGKPARTITAMVDRNGPAQAGPMASAAEDVLITVLNDQVNGIDPALLDAGGDQIEVAARFGGDASWRRIRRVVSQDADFVSVAV